MGTLTGAELVEEVRDNLGGRTDITDARILRGLNMAQDHMAAGDDWEELRVIDSGTLPFTSTPASDKFLPFSSLTTHTEPHEIFSFRIVTSDGRSRKMRYYPAREFDRQLPEPEYLATGIPSIYTVWAEKFELWKVTEAAYNYELRCTKWPTALAAGATPSDFNRKDDLLILLGTSWIFGSLGEYNRMRSFYGMYAERMKIASHEDDYKPDQDIVSPAGRAEYDVILGRPWADPFVKWIG